ncbi:sucrose transporter [Histoplasma capsulatum H143]|uniref:Sucrose transporter n=1 Tax=Ajellomyces capsulatus (strain H143) TaxID=544712 RepID=C6HPY6_AJECH|nr:sucrose transporter [Histoplasma capsulatum H143]
MNSSSPDRGSDRSPLLGGDEQPSSSGHNVDADANTDAGEVCGDAAADEFAKEACEDTERKSSWYLFLLTLSIGGLQIVWSVELSNGSPYVGIRSDNCRISWGKRKPFMIGGGIATIVSLLALAWTREIVGGILGIFGVPFGSEGVKVSSIVMATILMYCLDFANNTSRLTGIGNILGYISGYLDLPKILPLFGKTQFQVLCMIASLSLGITLLISCLFITERDPRLEGPPSSGNPGVISFFKQVFHSIRSLPPQIRKVCEVQLFAWVGWFPFLFYSTTYIGQLYVNPIFEERPHLPPEDIDEAWVAATRVGTFALLIYAIISFAASIILPLLVVPTYRPAILTPKSVASPTRQHPYLSRRESASAVSITISSAALPLPPPSQLSKPLELTERESASLLSRLQIPGFTLRRAWLMSHILFTICMFSTFFIKTPQAGTVVVSVVGISWAMTLWAPFALISAEVAKSDAKKRRRRYRLLHMRRDSSDGLLPRSRRREQQQQAVVASQEDRSDAHMAVEGDYGTPGLSYHSTASTSLPTPVATAHGQGDKNEQNNEESSHRNDEDDDNLIVDEREEDDEDDNESADDNEVDTTDEAGVILGIHNVAISFPQILSTLVSSAIFNALQKPRGEPWDDSVGWVMRFGGLVTIGAAVVTKRLAEGGSGSKVGLWKNRDAV